MLKMLITGFVFLLIQGNVCGQVARANISATITNPVGAELSDYINTNELIKPAVNTNLNEQNLKIDPVIKIIGEVFSYSVVIEQKDNLITKRQDEITTKKQLSIISVMVNFD